MSDVQLALGPVIFRSFELPTNITFGGKQRLATHRLSDGRRVVDCLGRDDSDIAFAGVLSGPDASLRARVLDRLRAAGGLLPLTWDAFFYTVAVREFAARYENDGWIPYRLICTVVRDEADGLLQAIASAAELLLEGVTTAVEYGLLGGVDLSGVLAAATAPGATEYGSGSYYIAQDSIGGAQATLTRRVTSAETSLSQADFGGTSAGAALAALNSGTVASFELAAAVQARGFLGCAKANLG